MHKKLLLLTFLVILTSACNSKAVDKPQPTVEPTTTISEPAITAGSEEAEEEIVENEDIELPNPTQLPTTKPSSDTESLNLEAELNQLDKDIKLGTGTDNISESDFLF